MNRDEISVRIGERLKQLRLARNMSLDALAQVTGVSKPMLAQIERGQSNPTVATLWKIASGLEVPFTTFVLESPETRVLRAEDQTVLFEDEDRYQVFNTFTLSGGHVELFRIRLLPGTLREAEGHRGGVSECITVSKGQLVVHVGAHEYELREGDALQFQADVPHSYANPHDVLCEASLAILYPYRN